MVELAWGLRPGPERRPSLHRRACREPDLSDPPLVLVPASEFRLRSRGRAYSFSLAHGDWFYFAGIWRPAKPDWPEVDEI